VLHRGSFYSMRSNNSISPDPSTPHLFIVHPCTIQHYRLQVSQSRVAPRAADFTIVLVTFENRHGDKRTGAGHCFSSKSRPPRLGVLDDRDPGRGLAWTRHNEKSGMASSAVESRLNKSEGFVIPTLDLTQPENVLSTALRDLGGNFHD